MNTRRSYFREFEYFTIKIRIDELNFENMIKIATPRT